MWHQKKESIPKSLFKERDPPFYKYIRSGLKASKGDAAESIECRLLSGGPLSVTGLWSNVKNDGGHNR